MLHTWSVAKQIMGCINIRPKKREIENIYLAVNVQSVILSHRIQRQIDQMWWHYLRDTVSLSLSFFFWIFWFILLRDLIEGNGCICWLTVGYLDQNVRLSAVVWHLYIYWRFHVCQHTLLYKVGLIMALHIKEYFCKIDLGFYLEPTINHGP